MNVPDAGRLTSRTRALVFALLAVALVAATHWQVLGLGFRTDDYATEVREALTGVWSGTRAFQDPYHRPLTGLYHAAQFALFGVSAMPLHAVSLLELAVVVWLFLQALWHEAPRPAALAGALVYVVQPLLRDSTSAWVFNQFHLLSLLIVLAAVRAWQHRRHDLRLRAWGPVFAWLALGAFVKEDVLLTLPALLVVQHVRARWLGDVPAPTRALWAGAGAVTVAVVLAHAMAVPLFGALREHGALSWEERAVSLGYALLRPFFARAHDALVPLGTLLLAGAPIAALVACVRKPSPAVAALTLTGGVLLIAWAAPLALQPTPSTTRVHLVTLAAAWLASAGLLAIADALRRAPAIARAAALAVCVAAIGSLHSAALAAQGDLYSACAPAQITGDAEASAWPITSDDVRAYLTRKAAGCAAGAPIEALAHTPTLTWPRPNGATVLVALGPDAHTVHLRDPDASADHPREVIVDAPGRRVAITLRSSAPQFVDVRLAPTWRDRVRGAVRIDVEADGPVLVR